MKTHQVARVMALLIGAACQETSAESTNQGASDASRFFGQTRESKGAVSIELTPERFVGGKLAVAVRTTTHSVDDLAKYDLRKLTTLEAQGSVVHPDVAPALAGHHTTGEMTFPLAGLPEAMTIEIRGLHEPAVRQFRWP